MNGYVFGDGHATWDGDAWTRVMTSHYHHADNYVRAKWYKMQWHKLAELKSYDVVIWIDGTIQLKALPDMSWTLTHDVLGFHHQARKDNHAEALASTDVRFEKHQDGLKRQLALYPKSTWLAVTCVLMNRRCEAVEKMYDLWFESIIEYGPQEQVALPYACDEFGVRVVLLNDGITHLNTQYFAKHSHLTKYKDYNS